jgi:prepilin-type N-terminal cleavage/methylation domain-containing protein
MKLNVTPTSKHAFSLVELSIVLVVLGLLVGGVLSGRSLIRASELRSVTTEYLSFHTAVRAFRDKYFFLPGDMTNATDFWGTDPAGCGSSAANLGVTCNGNGDGRITENPAAWEHLANSGLIAGSYRGGADHPCTSTPAYLSEVCPSAKIGNYWFLGRITAALGNGLIVGGSRMTPNEVWNIDTKADDGKPGVGKIYYYGSASNCTDSAVSYDPVANYLLTSDSKLCGVQFVNQY